MFRAKVRAAAVYFFAINYAPASLFSTFFSGSSVSFMMKLEFASFTIYVSVIRHRVSAEIYALLKRFPRCFKY
jgi:hypothetical protein